MRRSTQFAGSCGLLCLLAGGLPLSVRAENYVLLIGVGKYEQKSIPSLDFDINDVHGLEQTFLKNAGYSRDHVIVMTTEAKPDDPNYPSLKHVYQKLRGLQTLPTLKASDTLFVYFSGHGIADAASKQQYLLFADADLQLLDKTAFSLKDLRGELDKIKTHQKIIILDACRSDITLSPGTTKDINPQLDKGLTTEAASITSEANPNSIYKFIFACSPGQKAQVFDKDHQNSVFSYYLIEGLRGKALKQGQRLTLGDLYEYVYPKVKEWSKEHKVEQQPLTYGGEGEPIAISDNVHYILPARLELKGLEPDVKVELTPQKYNPATGEVELDGDKQSGTLTLRRPGYKAQTRPVTFQSEAVETVTAAPWENDPNSRIRFILPKLPAGAQWGKLTFDTEAISLEKDPSGRVFRGNQLDVRAHVMDFVLDKNTVNFSIGLLKTNKNAPPHFGPAPLQGGHSYEIKLAGNNLLVTPEESVFLQMPPDPGIKVYVVPEGADYQVTHTDKGILVRVKDQVQEEHPANSYAKLDMGLEDEKQFWALCYANGKLQRKTIHVSKEAARSYRETGNPPHLQLPTSDDNTDATLDLAALPPGVSATVKVEGRNYAIEGAERHPLTVSLESHSATATVTIHAPQFDSTGFPVTLTAGQTKDLKAELATALLREQITEVVGSGSDKITIVGIDGKAPTDLPAPNAFKAKVGTQVTLTLQSPGCYLTEKTISVSPDSKQIQVEMVRHGLQANNARVVKNPLDGADMIYIPAAPYAVGTVSPDKAHEFGPSSASGGFWIYAYPVTVGQYSAFLKAKQRNAGKPMAGDDSSRLPITGVTYEDAQAYAAWAGGSLPKETEWEIAARGGGSSVYPWGEDWKQSKDWRYGKDGLVGSNTRNHSTLGVYDIWGHVREWTISSSAGMMIRGSSIAKQDQKRQARLTWRSVEDAKAGKDYDDVGFRVVMRGTNVIPSAKTQN